MAYFVGTAMGFSGSQRSAPFGICSFCGGRQHHDTTGQYVVGCPFQAGRGSSRSSTQSRQVANVYIGGNGVSVVNRASTPSKVTWHCGDCDGQHTTSRDDKGKCQTLLRSSASREKMASAAVGRMTWRQTGKVQKSSKSTRPTSTSTSIKSRGSGFVTPPRRTRPASTNAPKKSNAFVSVGNGGVNVVQIQQIQNVTSRSGGGTGQLAIGGGGGYGIRRKVTTPNYLPAAVPTQRVHPSGYLYFR